MRSVEEFWDTIEATDPEVWPGSTPWKDEWGSFGTVPDSLGFGSTVERTRIPDELLPVFWQAIQRRYGSAWPRFHVGPRDTAGLRSFLAREGYVRESEELMLVLESSQWHRIPSVSTKSVRPVTSMGDLNEVIHLDHLVFGDPLRDEHDLQMELSRLGQTRRLFYVPGTDGVARAAGGWTQFPGWVLFWGAETHPDWRHRGLYHQILRARLEALPTGSDLFIGVSANRETSAPILSRYGFQSVGTREVWRPPS